MSKSKRADGHGRIVFNSGLSIGTRTRKHDGEACIARFLKVIGLRSLRDKGRTRSRSSD
jgi:hypothetical protein